MSGKTFIGIILVCAVAFGVGVYVGDRYIDQIPGFTQENGEMEGLGNQVDQAQPSNRQDQSSMMMQKNDRDQSMMNHMQNQETPHEMMDEEMMNNHGNGMNDEEMDDHGNGNDEEMMDDHGNGMNGGDDDLSSYDFSIE